jgi:hypothetical protein
LERGKRVRETRFYERAMQRDVIPKCELR